MIEVSEREQTMPKKRMVDAALMDSIASSLLEALPVFPKKLLGIDMLQRNHRIPLSHIQILVMLRDGDLSVGDLSRRLGIAKPNITPLIDSLRDEGLVERIRSDGDRRVVNIHLLPAGQVRLAEVRASLGGMASLWGERLNRSEAKELNNALASLLRILGSLTEGE